jgi:hypothetical protein
MAGKSDGARERVPRAKRETSPRAIWQVSGAFFFLGLTLSRA